MKSRKDFYKYNLILAFLVFFLILIHIDNTTTPPSRTISSVKPNFTPTRYVATAQKARQEIYITLTSQKSDSANLYDVQGFVESASLGGSTLNYRWILAPGQELLSGSLTGTLIPEQNGSLLIRLKINESSEKSRVRLEVFAESNGTKIGNVKSFDLKESPSESQVQAEAQAQSKIQSESKSKTDFIQDILASDPSPKVLQ